MNSDQAGRSEGCTRIALGLGSNMGDRLANLRTGLTHVQAMLDDPSVSALYDTEPAHIADQPRFLNACCTGGTSLPPHELLAELKRIERQAGRDPGGSRYGPRVLDLDILLYGDQVIDEPGLRIPHPRLAERAFVLIPLAEIAGEWPVPGTSPGRSSSPAAGGSRGGGAAAEITPNRGALTVAELARRLPARDVQGVRRLADAADWAG